MPARKAKEKMVSESFKAPPTLLKSGRELAKKRRMKFRTMLRVLLEEAVRAGAGGPC